MITPSRLRATDSRVPSAAFSRRTLASLLTLLFVFMLFNATCAAQSDFWAPAVDKGAHLPADKVFPQGRIFPYGGYSGVAVREKENYFTLHGPVYGDAVYTMRENAKAAGMYAIFTVGIPMNFYETDGKPALNLTPAEIAAEIKRQVEAVMEDETIAWWYLMPEELRPWRVKEMEYLEVAARTIRETDPYKRPVWMYDPGHRNASELAVTAQHLDILGKGMYTNYSEQLGSRIWCRWGIENQQKALAANGRPGAIHIAVPEMFQEPAPEDAAKIPSWARHDVYLALVSGAQGVVPFSLAYRSGFSQSSWEAYYNAYAKIARELNGELALGQVFLFGERRDDLRLTITAGEQTVWPQLKPGFIDEIYAYPSVSMANIAYGNQRYVFLVNSSEEPVEVRLDGFPAEPTYVRDAFTNQPLPVIEGAVSLAMPGLGVVGFRLSQGYIWIDSPPEAALSAPQTPIEIEAYGVTPSRVDVRLDGELLYGGTSLPTDLYLRPAELTGGEHRLEVTVVDASGNTEQASRVFRVEHLRLAQPDLRWGATLKDDIHLALDLSIAPHEVRRLVVSLTAIVGGEPSTQYVIYSGDAVPEKIRLETARFPDGAYDLVVDLAVTTGITASFTERVVFANWQTLSDALLPPQTLGWFGPDDRLKTVDRSDGWEFTTDNPGQFFGDGDRMRPRSAAAEYLAWQLQNLRYFTLTFYARHSELERLVTVAVSSDGATWQDVAYEVQVAEQAPDGRRKLLVTGSVPDSSSMRYLRVTVAGDPTNDLEIGDVHLVAKR
ncbi:MAG TPA: hypothetical protein GXZ82_11695 [Firmicutes bacterium]|nr:hypothetical protein [Bacillota bacterium]